MYRLIDEVRSKIKPYPCARSSRLAPALSHSRAKAVDVALIVRDFAEHSRLENCFAGEDLTVPSSIVKHREQLPMLLCSSKKRTSLRESNGKRLVDNHALASPQRGGGERKMALIRTSGDD